ncbi:MAG: AAA family ATPase [Acidaminococcaceae bacterium]|nr:AAA family ATPase [Acidaminococcaceae bacterium]
MLKEFKVMGFKNFKEELFFDLGTARNYEFNSDVVKNGVVKTALVYGINGSGKSNLGYAIFDLIGHLTDKRKTIDKYDLYLNLEKDIKKASFYYKFQFGKDILEYHYEKKSYVELTREIIKINGNVVIDYNHELRNLTIPIINLRGAENLNSNLGNSKISFVKYLSNNTKLDNRVKENRIFNKFIGFVDNMLFFRSLKTNEYQGFMNSNSFIHNEIVKHGKLNEFQKFLSENKLNYDLATEHRDDKEVIVCKFSTGKTVDLGKIYSTGTEALSLFFYWKIFFEKISFVFIDEFDAFYHYEIAKNIIEVIKQTKGLQGVMTTHNTDVMSNDLLRPDCYFILNENKISSLADATEKELRCAHNLQKMYKAGAFKV